MPRLPKNRPPTHPGEILQEEFLTPMEITQSALAERIGISFQRVNQIVNGKRGITPNTALRLARFFGTTPELWMNLQASWDLWHAQRGKTGAEIRRIRPVRTSRPRQRE